MARPRKPTQSKRCAWIGYRVTADDKARIVAQAERAGLRLGEYARRSALTTEIKIQPTPRADFETADQLRRLGVNLNQIARAVNTGGQLPAYLERLCERIETTLDKIFDEDLARGSPDC